jgi:hypothetical protein
MANFSPPPSKRIFYFLLFCRLTFRHLMEEVVINEISQRFSMGFLPFEVPPLTNGSLCLCYPDFCVAQPVKRSGLSRFSF